MLEITTHHVEGAQNTVRIFPEETHEDKACSLYMLAVGMPGQESGARVKIKFQDGPLKEVGARGLTNESLLAIVLHRLQAFQKGIFPCHENEVAINKVQEALDVLKARTEDRVKRKVEGHLKA